MRRTGPGAGVRSEASSRSPERLCETHTFAGPLTYLPTSALGGSTHAGDPGRPPRRPGRGRRRRPGALPRAVGPHPRRGGRGGAGRGHRPVRRRRRPRRAVPAAHRVDAGRGRAARRSSSRSRSTYDGPDLAVVAEAWGIGARRGGGPAHLAGVRRGVLRLRARASPTCTGDGEARAARAPPGHAPRPGPGRVGGAGRAVDRHLPDRLARWLAAARHHRRRPVGPVPRAAGAAAAGHPGAVP